MHDVYQVVAKLATIRGMLKAYNNAYDSQYLIAIIECVEQLACIIQQYTQTDAPVYAIPPEETNECPNP